MCQLTYPISSRGEFHDPVAFLAPSTCLTPKRRSINTQWMNEWISNAHSCLKRTVCDSWWCLHVIAWDDRFILSDSPVSPLKAFLASRESHHLKKEPERVTLEVGKLSLLASSSLIYTFNYFLKKKFKLEHVTKPLGNKSNLETQWSAESTKLRKSPRAHTPANDSWSAEWVHIVTS